MTFEPYCILKFFFVPLTRVIFHMSLKIVLLTFAWDPMVFLWFAILSKRRFSPIRKRNNNFQSTLPSTTNVEYQFNRIFETSYRNKF